jgi:hypothetical protein
MIKIVLHHDYKMLPSATENLIPVQLYGIEGKQRGDVWSVGNPVLDEIKRLGLELPPPVFDFLSIALAVTAADTFVKRENADDGWTREFIVQLPLFEPTLWNNSKQKLEKALRFLSGDMWSFEFLGGGANPPVPCRRRGTRLTHVRDLDCVSLFSGGLDSAIGVIDLLSDGRKPLLISHKYKGDKRRQEAIARKLLGRYSHFSANASPISSKIGKGKNDNSMRTRSINFLAFAVAGAYAVQAVNQPSRVELFVPENQYRSARLFHGS